MRNPLIQLGFEIPFDEVDAVHVQPAVDALLADAQAAVDAIAESEAPRTYANTLGALEEATEQLERAMSVVDHLESVATTEALRVAFNATRPRVSAFWSELAMNDGLYQAMRAFAATDDARALPPTDKRFLDKTLDDFRRHGAELSPEDKDKLHAIDIDLTKLTTQFSQNVLDETNAFELVITDESKIAGLPESAKQAAAENAAVKGVEGWRFTLHAPSMIPVLTYLDDAGIREHVWRAYNTRAVSGTRDNRPIIGRVLELRGAKAKLLGYADFSDLVTEDRMAKVGTKAKAFIDDLRARTEGAFERENRELQAYRMEIEGESARALEPWDVAYYSEKQRQAKYDFNEEDLRPYFPLGGVLDGLFATAQALYEIEIVERDAAVWDPEVKSYAIRSRDGTMIAAFYEPALLTHREVETLFHEFGHLLHHCFSKVSVRGLAGTNVAWDFVELPSQIMENWCWERSGLDLFAAHYETNERIPDELYEKMVRARTYRAANAQMRQLGFAAVDLALHQSYDPAADGDAMAYARDILQGHSATTLPVDYAMLAGFGHIFAHPVGYAAGYYSYKWAEVLDADAFTRFKKEGITNPEVGRAFRETILSKGNSQEAETLYLDFMGRGPKLDPLLERAGLS
jgi:oligopeptidase A